MSPNCCYPVHPHHKPIDGNRENVHFAASEPRRSFNLYTIPRFLRVWYAAGLCIARRIQTGGCFSASASIVGLLTLTHTQTQTQTTEWKSKYSSPSMNVVRARTLNTCVCTCVSMFGVGVVLRCYTSDVYVPLLFQVLYPYFFTSMLLVYAYIFLPFASADAVGKSRPARQCERNVLCYDCCVAGRLQGKLLPSLRQSNGKIASENFHDFPQSAYVRRRFSLDDVEKSLHRNECLGFNPDYLCGNGNGLAPLLSVPSSLFHFSVCVLFVWVSMEKIWISHADIAP